jgi:hypothetical protein
MKLDEIPSQPGLYEKRYHDLRPKVKTIVNIYISDMRIAQSEESEVSTLELLGSSVF